MTDDLVKRLRNAAENNTTKLNRSHLVVEAADRIEKLEKDMFETLMILTEQLPSEAKCEMAYHCLFKALGEQQ